LQEFTPFQLGAGRYLFATLPLVLVIRPPHVHWKWIVLYGLTQGLGQFGLLFTALSVGMTSALASVLMQVQVFFTALFGVLLLGERLGLALRFGMILAAIALACFSIGVIQDAGSPHGVLGFVLNLAAAAMWASSNIVARYAQKASPNFDALAFVVWSALVPILPFIGLSIAFDDRRARMHWMASPPATWMAVAYLGWMATVIGYGLWTWLLKRHPANDVAPFSLAVPVVGLTAGVLLLNEAIDPWQIVGIVLVLAALFVVMLGPKLIPCLRESHR
jgi:O-acetylserine/cysteine efflux transporter